MLKTLEDIDTELDQIADAARYADYCHRHWLMFTKRQLLNVCDERGLSVKKSDKKDNILSVLEKDYIREMEEFDARAVALQEEKAAIKAQIAARLEKVEPVEPVEVVAQSIVSFNFKPFFQALAMCIAAFVLPYDVIGAENIALYDAASVEFLRWCEAHPDVNITPLAFGYFVEHEPEQPEETLDDAIARLLDTMNEAAQSSDYPTWYEAAEELKLLQCVEDTNPTRLEVPVNGQESKVGKS